MPLLGKAFFLIKNKKSASWGIYFPFLFWLQHKHTRKIRATVQIKIAEELAAVVNFPSIQHCPFNDGTIWSSFSPGTRISEQQADILAHVNTKGESTTTASGEMEAGQHDVNHWVSTPNIFSSFLFSFNVISWLPSWRDQACRLTSMLSRKKYA